MATRPPILPALHPPAVERSSSDSVVNNNGTPDRDVKGGKDHGTEHAELQHLNAQREDVAIQTTAQGTLVVAARALPKSKPAPAAPKTRQPLQLPSFHSLGIAVRCPISILTPPDEPAPMTWASPGMDQSQTTPTLKGPVSSELHASTSPQTPLPPGSVHRASNDTPTQGAVASLISPSIQSGNDPGSGSTNSSSATEIASRMPWLEQALGAILPFIASGSNAEAKIDILCHPQPCPLSRAVMDASNAPTPSALPGIVNALQARFEHCNDNRYIEVTHAVPSKFSFAQLPNSPVTTPNRPGANMGDYFSMPKTVVYTKGVTAASHAESLKILEHTPNGRAAPQTVVAPSTITISVLERYIPPATGQEYRDLFNVTRPSALVDRMTELKRDNGLLVLVYPTYQGAQTFKKRHLFPILDPQLRTMNLVDGIPIHLATDIGALEATQQMYSYDDLRAAVSGLITSMNVQGNGNLHQFALAVANKETIYLGREAWVEWYLEQELPRIRNLINDFYGRTLRKLQPSQEANARADYTAAGYVGQIVDAIKERVYEEPPHEAIEVGVFVIKRFR
ncbi:MAG: hypothetical protein Q9181_002287 [Wetmoreana brouardii]